METSRLRTAQSPLGDSTFQSLRFRLSGNLPPVTNLDLVLSCGEKTSTDQSGLSAFTSADSGLTRFSALRPVALSPGLATPKKAALRGMNARCVSEATTARA